jgi:hypothetical protein
VSPDADLRDAVTCVAGYGALIADAAAAGEAPDPAWVAALRRGADDVLARYATAATGTIASAGS